MNEKLIKIFSDLAVYEQSLRRIFPAKAYLNVVKILKNLDFEVTAGSQIESFEGVGAKISKKVDEFIKNGTFKRYEEYLASDVAKFKEMSEIKGIGPNKAKLIYESGIHNIEELKNAVKSLKIGEEIGKSGVNYLNSMKIGLTFQAHTSKNRMTVQEHDAVADPILKAIKSYQGIQAADAVGSRRRFDGSKDYTIGDIDIIISIPHNLINSDLTKYLESLLDNVIMSGNTKISGIKEKRQVDIRFVEPISYGALLMHSTGPMNFNIYCRKIAIQKNMVLNEYGLFDRNTKKCIESQSEENILNKLGIGWVSPENRKNY